MTAWTIYNPAGSSVHGIFQARVLEWIAIFSPGELPDPLLLHGQVGFFFFYHQANRESAGAGPWQVAPEQGPQEAILKELSRHEARNQHAIPWVSAVTNHAAQLAIIKQVTRQESRSSAGPDHVTLQALITWLIKSRSRD